MSSAMIVLALIVFQRLRPVPRSYISVVFGCRLLTCVVPVISTPSPTMRFFVTAAPPAVLKLPLFKLVLAVLFVTMIAPVSVRLPSMSKAWLGVAWFIPTLLSTTLRIVEGIPSRLVWISIELPAALLYILAAVAVVPMLKVPSTPTVTPLLFLILNAKSVVLIVSDLKNFPDSTSTPPTLSALARVAVPNNIGSNPPTNSAISGAVLGSDMLIPERTKSKPDIMVLGVKLSLLKIITGMSAI